jgi:hypothetical protein
LPMPAPLESSRKTENVSTFRQACDSLPNKKTSCSSCQPFMSDFCAMLRRVILCRSSFASCIKFYRMIMLSTFPAPRSDSLKSSHVKSMSSLAFCSDSFILLSFLLILDLPTFPSLLLRGHSTRRKRGRFHEDHAIQTAAFPVQSLYRLCQIAASAWRVAWPSRLYPVASPL